jgi:ketosteroid isomerase-like protein
LTVVMTPRKNGARVKRAGDVLSILQKQSGKWVIVRDANMLTPAD